MPAARAIVEVSVYGLISVHGSAKVGLFYGGEVTGDIKVPSRSERYLPSDLVTAAIALVAFGQPA